MPCSFVEDDWCFRGAYCLHHQGSLMIEAVSTSEMSVSFYESAWHNIPEDCHLHTCHHEKLKSQLCFFLIPDISFQHMNFIGNHEQLIIYMGQVFHCNRLKLKSISFFNRNPTYLKLHSVKQKIQRSSMMCSFLNAESLMLTKTFGHLLLTTY
jgi:hypothetical protein